LDSPKAALALRIVRDLDHTEAAVAGTAGGRFGFGALNPVRTAAGAGGPRQIQLAVKFYF